MADQKIPIILNLIAALVGAAGQYFYKKGGVILASGGKFFNLPTIVGIVLFCIVMLFFVLAYKMGGKISIVYPFYATTFVWGALIGYLFEKEPFNLLGFVGLLLVVAGVSVMAVSLAKSIS